MKKQQHKKRGGFVDKMERPTGTFEMKVIKNGKVVEIVKEKNLVVDAGKDALCDILTDSGSGREVSHIAVGTDNTAPDAADTIIANEVTAAISGYTNNGDYSLRIDWTIDESTANSLPGGIIYEYGLKCADGTLFARKTRAGIAKDATVRLEGRWTIQF